MPLVGLAAAAGAGVSANADEARSISRQAELATASIGHAGVIGVLQNERNLALAEMLGLADEIELEVTDQEVARQQTNEATAALRRGISGQSGALRDDYATALTVLDDLPDVRANVDAARRSPGPANRERAHEVFQAYTTMLSTFFTSHDRFSLVVDDPALRQGDDLLHYSSHATDATAQLMEMVLYIGSSRGGLDEPAEAAAVARLQRDVGKNNDVVRVKGTGGYLAPTEELLANPRVAGLPVLVDDLIERGGSVDQAELLATTPLGPDGGYPAFRDGVVEVLDAKADSLHDAAETRRKLYLGGAFALVAVALLIAWAVSRSITRPLRDLSVKARQMATYRLPAAVEEILVAPPGEDLVVPEADPIVVSARDEVADVAGAFNDVQHAAVGLAVEQAALRRNVAESYINLGRRNQNLLGRLIDGLGELARDETDPGRLDQIHRLDHLATRIRRHADSLLVLSQADPTPGFQAPVEIADVVGAALGEIENHERVLVRSLDPAMLPGGASSDLAHLLAELIENGLRHSPPRELVEVSGRAGAGGYAINIVDHGLGMAPEDIERANQRLAGTESFTVTPAKYLGHYVTAVLAARHGIKVRLQGSVVVGIAALVELPPSLLTASAVAGPPRNPYPPMPLPAPAPAPGPIDVMSSDEPGVTPSAEDVRNAVALLRAGGALVRPARPAPSVPYAGGAALPARRPVTAFDAGARPLVVVPDEVTSAAPPAPVPERTANGLVRRVRGAHGPVATAAAQPAPGPDPNLANGDGQGPSTDPAAAPRV
ncbi:MAG TPA: nitrate- and nitrite sensing domain-containing protein, partial [Acidimicrobiales bacterium]